MPDRDDLGSAWKVPPSRYLAGRPAEHRLGKPSSTYVTMPDGCRLAVDVFLPDGDAGRRWPTILILTPYVRRFELAPGATGVEPSPNTSKYRDTFVPRGYALVVVDARGTGASFGTRDSFRSPRERDDYRVLADWIVAQPWSDGAIGATGISYLGAACDFLASTGHKAVRAIAPLFAVWDTWADNYYPGGLLIKRLALVYDELMLALDHDRRDLRAQFAYFANPALLGPLPVDEDRDGSLARKAVRGHLANFRMPDFITEFKFRDDALPYDPSFTSASFSPYNYLDEIPPDVAVYAVSGWMDGAGYANGALSRFLTLPNAERRLLLGPWDHGARVNASPWRGRMEPELPVLGEVLRFFDQHLAGRDTGLAHEAPIHYFTMHAEEWRAAPAWPPTEGKRVFFATSGNGLATVPPGPGTTDRIEVDFTWGSGSQTRYERIAGIDATDYYADWSEREGKLASFTSSPLEEALEIAGHPVVSLWLASSEPDAAVFVYLSEVEADGTSRYVTEGLLRAIHRAEAPAPRNYRTTWPWRTFARKDARPMPTGEPQLLRFALLPIAWRFAKGSRLRLSIAGADADHFVQAPHGRPPVLTVLNGGAQATMLELPV
ncbi:MAG: CocE/NonD family hydrolase [Reyranella sp.]|uniref:CocE/NonD family hydrolase n=1 Tax=Reyranella sp. TaxID=1929291 RepID=UPI0025F17351|nr:CocE/NonD family hydrolase [Reyranella sp.]MBR2814567.1 CocE/NonD family hydrolase [Reyranella sp.]